MDTTMQNPPLLLSPIRSPKQSQRDPRLRKTFFTRAQAKLLATLKELAVANNKLEQLTSERTILEDQLEAIGIIRSKNEYLTACREQLGRRMMSDYQLEVTRNKKCKLQKALNLIPVSYTHLTLPTTPYV